MGLGMCRLMTIFDFSILLYLAVTMVTAGTNSRNLLENILKELGAFCVMILHSVNCCQVVLGLLSCTLTLPPTYPLYTIQLRASMAT